MRESSDFDLSGGATTEAQGEHVKPASPFLELQIVSPSQQELRLPFLYSRIDFAKSAGHVFPQGVGWEAHLSGDVVELVHEDGDRHPLEVGSCFELDGVRVWLLDARRPAVGTLECLTPPYVGKIWNLTSQQTWLGRKGKRLNHVEVNHSTVSRTHATFLPDRQGRIELLTESAGAPTAVNGKAVEVGQKVRLSNGALIGCGELLFRFRASTEDGSAESLLSINTLGTFQVKLGSTDHAPNIGNEKAQFLLAALAVKWGEPRSVDWILSQFWPEVTSARGRKNLSYTLVQLRENLGVKGTEHDNLFIRASSNVQLNPDRLGDHDYMELARLTVGKKPLTSRPVLERAIRLYSGHFMPNCYDEWAEVVRQSLETDFTQTLLRTASHSMEDLDTVTLATSKLRALDPLNEEAVALFMEACLHAAQPSRAVEAYEKLVKELKAEGLEPTTEVMKIYYKANLGLG
jgi:DNA-binding SARP family transcriptional activator